MIISTPRPHSPRGEERGYGQLATDYEGGGDGGSVYRYIGTGETIDLERKITPIQRREKVVLETTESPAEVQAYIKNSSVSAEGSITQNATAQESINALVLSGSVALAGGGKVGVGLSGSGVGVQNRISTRIRAYIDGDGATGISADQVTLQADDTSTINVLPSSIAGGGSRWLRWRAVSIGVSLAQNEVGNVVEAYLKNADNQVETTVGGITVEATERATIRAYSTAASLAAAGGFVGLAISGAGAEATNIILNETNAYVQNSVVDSAGDVIIHAENTSNITATVGALSASVAVGGVGIGVSIGAAVARNLIGWDASGNRVPALVQAFIRDSSVAAEGDLSLTAKADETIDATVLAGSFAIGGATGVAGSGAGVSTVNRIATHVNAFIEGDGENGISADNLTLHAEDVSVLRRKQGASGGEWKCGVSVSVGVALAENHISNEVTAYIRMQ